MPTGQIGTVYLLHFSRPYYHARHYLGFTRDVEQRLRYHLRGRGSPLVRAALACGIEIFLAREWDHVTRRFERRVHNIGRNARGCPICRGPRAYHARHPRRDPGTGIGA